MADRNEPLPRGSLAALVEQYAQALAHEHVTRQAPGTTSGQREAAFLALVEAERALMAALDALDAQEGS